jgi:hypothetical protein
MHKNTPGLGVVVVVVVVVVKVSLGQKSLKLYY